MSSAYTVRYAPQALDDLRDLYSYVAFSLKEPATAQKLVNRIRKADRSKHPYRNSRSYCLWWAESSKPRKIDPCGKFPTFLQ